MIGKEGIEKVFERKFSDRFNIHRTRINFPNNGLDDFPSMAKKGIEVVDRVVIEEMNGKIDIESNTWIIPQLFIN
jgi:hypothetical protein